MINNIMEARLLDKDINEIGSNRYERKRRRKYSKFSLSMALLVLYIFFFYTAQNTLFPPIIHSIVMYMFIGWTVVLFLIGKKFRITNYTLWYSVCFILSLLSLLYASHDTLDTLYAMFVILIITFCVINALNSRDKLLICVKTFVWSSVIMGVMLIVTGQVFNDSGLRLGEEVTGNANSFSILFMIAAVFSSWIALYKTKRIMRVNYIVIAIFQLFLMGMSGGRKTIITVIACLIWFMLAKDLKNSLRTLWNIIKVAIVLVAVYLAVMNIPVLYNAIGERFESLFSLIFGGQSNWESDILRGTMVQIALEKWIDSPICGYGLDTFKYYNQIVTGHFYYAHNNFVEMLYDFGAIGFFVYYGFIVWLLVKFIKMKNVENGPLKILGIGLIIELLLFDVGGVSYYIVVTQLLLCIAFCTFDLCCRRNEKSEVSKL